MYHSCEMRGASNVVGVWEIMRCREDGGMSESSFEWVIGCG